MSQSSRETINPRFPVHETMTHFGGRSARYVAISESKSLKSGQDGRGFHQARDHHDRRISSIDYNSPAGLLFDDINSTRM